MKFSTLAKYMKSIEDTASRTDMTVLLSQVFSEAESDEIESLCYLLQGRVAPQYESIEFGIADKLLIRAIAQAYELDIKIVTRAFKEAGDLGIAAQELVKSRKHTPNFDKEYSVSQVFEILLKLATTSGEGSQDEKILIISELLRALDPLSVRFVVRIPLDKLRLGFSDMTILDAFSWMLTGDKSHRNELERAFNVSPDIGYIAKAIKQHGIGGISRVHARVGAPILAALCQRIPTADEMIEKMGEVAVEPKYDGVRVQIHFKRQGISGKGQEVKAFSRNLENTTLMYPELSEIGEELNASEVILDCEAVGFDRESGQLATFQETMTRKRKHDIEETSKRMPLKFFVFDMLYKDGVDLLSMPLRERKAVLQQTLLPKVLLTQSPYILTSDAQELREYHDLQLDKGLEGVVIKKWDSGYEPGRKNYSWVKFKEEEGKAGKLTDTIDAVIMGYSRGEGKRSGFGIGMFLVGVRTEEGFVTVTKIGTGVTDDMWKSLNNSLESIQVGEMPKEYKLVNKQFIPDVWVAPKVVVEIAGDDLTKSSTHGAGIAVRFPRLVRIRSDKSSEQATTVEELQTMFSGQKQSTLS